VWPKRGRRGASRRADTISPKSRLFERQSTVYWQLAQQAQARRAELFQISYGLGRGQKNGDRRGRPRADVFNGSIATSAPRRRLSSSITRPCSVRRGGGGEPRRPRSGRGGGRRGGAGGLAAARARSEGRRLHRRGARAQGHGVTSDPGLASRAAPARTDRRRGPRHAYFLPRPLPGFRKSISTLSLGARFSRLG
jgi:hypothetical protein